MRRRRRVGVKCVNSNKNTQINIEYRNKLNLGINNII